MNVFDYAMKMEVDGKAFYEKLAASTSVTGLRKIFRMLAEDEQKHYEIFQALKEETPVGQMKDSGALESSENIFSELLGKERETLREVRADLEGYHYAMKLETDSALLYEGAADKEENPEVKSLLRRIAAEEYKHFTILENIYNFFNAPNQYLAWREFSNLDEFHNFGRKVDR